MECSSFRFLARILEFVCFFMNLRLLYLCACSTVVKFRRFRPWDERRNVEGLAKPLRMDKSASNADLANTPDYHRPREVEIASQNALERDEALANRRSATYSIRERNRVITRAVFGRCYTEGNQAQNMASDVRLCARSDSFTSFSITGAKATLYHHERRDENDEKATLYDFLAKTPRRRARVEPKTSTSLPPLVRRRMTSSVAAAKPKRARKTHRKAKHVRESISVSNVEAFAAKAPQRRRRDVNVTLRNAFSMLEVAPAPQQSKSSSTREKAGSCRVKIYQSERQSEMMIGIPAAPPATPTPGTVISTAMFPLLYLGGC